MSATLTCKCPKCDRITSRCIDHDLTKDRTEYDGKVCRRCAVQKHNQTALRNQAKLRTMIQTHKGMFVTKIV